jgi:hypothetical protein
MERYYYNLNPKHSPCDAVAPALMIEYAANKEPAVDPENATNFPQIEPFRHLNWDTDLKIEESLSRAQEYAVSAIRDSDMEVALLNYGGNFIKKYGNCKFKQAKLVPIHIFKCVFN